MAQNQGIGHLGGNGGLIYRDQTAVNHRIPTWAKNDQMVDLASPDSHFLGLVAGHVVMLNRVCLLLPEEVRVRIVVAVLPAGQFQFGVQGWTADGGDCRVVKGGGFPSTALVFPV